MRFFTSALSLFAAVVIAQTSTTQQNAIIHPANGFNPVAGQELTLSWQDPSSGTVTIKLQNGDDITPSSGVVLASNVQASDEKATFQIPSNVVNSAQYTFEIIDDTNPNNINFSRQFAISGATGVSSMITSTASSASSSATDSSSTDSSSSSASSSSSESSSSSHSSSSASRTSSASSTRTSSSASSTATTAVPNSNTNAASNLKVEGSLVALVAGLLALF